VQKNKIGSGVMSALAWNAKRILLLLSWIFVCVVLMIVLPEHKIISFIIAVIFAGITSKIFYHCPHCGKMVDLRIFIHHDTKCSNCGNNLVGDFRYKEN